MSKQLKNSKRDGVLVSFSKLYPDVKCNSQHDFDVPCPDCYGGALKEHIVQEKVYGTTVETKRSNFDKFASLISDQFNHGGDKYSLPGFDDREATDVISSVFGGKSQFDWVLGTMMKYLFRFKNFEREKDLLKIATYCYILWLKQGNHLKNDHDTDTKK